MLCLPMALRNFLIEIFYRLLNIKRKETRHFNYNCKDNQFDVTSLYYADLFVLDQIIWIVLVFVVNAEYFRIIYIIHTGVKKIRVGILGIDSWGALVIWITLIPFSTQYLGQKHVFVSIFICSCVQVGIFGVSGKIRSKPK